MIEDELKEILEREERETVGTAFGGSTQPSHNSYSVSQIRDFLASRIPSMPLSAFEQALSRMQLCLPGALFKISLGNTIRFSFLIELTNLTVGSTKMKTRWLPGRILMAQAGSFEPIQGVFKPGNDPRSASFEECAAVFVQSAHELCDRIEFSTLLFADLFQLNRLRRVPYEFPLGYADAASDPLHRASNVEWIFNDDIRWLIRARQILNEAPSDSALAIKKICKAKLEVKVFKTDRALTGKDKTNRAKRWEVLAGDFQHATLAMCWSAERKLTHDLACFESFPKALRERFIKEALVCGDAATTRCPVTLEVLNFENLASAVLDPTHGVSPHQIGHLHPLKRQGNHDGENVCWQSANGNRIQGDLSIEETNSLLDQIAQRRAALRA